MYNTFFQAAVLEGVIESTFFRAPSAQRRKGNTMSTDTQYRKAIEKKSLKCEAYWSVTRSGLLHFPSIYQKGIVFVFRIVELNILFSSTQQSGVNRFFLSQHHSLV